MGERGRKDICQSEIGREKPRVLAFKRRDCGALKQYKHFLQGKFAGKRARGMENSACPAASDPNGKEIEECEELVIDIPPDLPPAQWPECCINRVPKKLREVNKEAYIPKLVSIGPFHYLREDLRNMEIQKLRYLGDFCCRTGKGQEDLLKIIKDKEVKIRHCYSETFEHSSEKFVKMILLDAIFIIELSLRKRDRKNDYITSQPWLRAGIRHDLLLLENQLPFFILEKLYMFALDDSSSCNHCEEGDQIEEHKKSLKKQDAPFVTLSRNYFCYYDQHRESIGEEVKHFTDLLRYMFCSVPGLRPKTHLKNRYCATKLNNAGLKFKAVEERRLLEIKLAENRCLGRFRCFDCSCLLACLPCLKCFPCLEHMQCILEVPPFEIYNATEGLFRNLMALEQCHYPFNAYICSYILLLDDLIDTERDVDLLIDKKVIANNIGSNEAVATLIHKLGDQIVTTRSCYSDIAQKLNEHYEYLLNHILATLTSVYFRDFWRGTATVAALVVLCLTFCNFFRPYHYKK